MLQEDDLDNEENTRRRDDFTKQMKSNIGDYCTATLKNWNDYNKECPYDFIFEFDNEVDDEEIEFQELEALGDVVLKSNVEDFIHS